MMQTGTDTYWTFLKESLLALEKRVHKLEQLEVPLPGFVEVYVGGNESDVLVTNSFQDIPGAAVTLEPGEYAVTGNLGYKGPSNTNDDGQEIRLALSVGGIDQPHVCEGSIRFIDGVQPVYNCISSTWNVVVTADTLIKLRVAKTGGAGGTVVRPGTSIVALGIRH